MKKDATGFGFSFDTHETKNRDRVRYENLRPHPMLSKSTLFPL